MLLTFLSDMPDADESQDNTPPVLTMLQRRKRYLDKGTSDEVPDSQDTQHTSKRRKGNRKPLPSMPDERPRDELDIYLAEPTVNAVVYEKDPVSWWRDVGAKRFPKLSYMAVNYLTIPSSTAETERQFNSVGRMISASRSCLARHVVASSQCLRSWSLAGVYEPSLPLELLDSVDGVELQGPEATRLDRWARDR